MSRYSDSGSEASYDSELDERDELDKVDPTDVARRQLTCINMLLCLFASGTGAFAYMTALNSDTSLLMWGVVVVAIFVVLMSCLGCCGSKSQNQGVLLLYQTLLMVSAAGALLMGGFCFLLNSNANQLLVESETVAEQEEDEGDDNDMSSMLYIAGAAAIFILSLLMCAMSSIVHIVEPQRAYSLIIFAGNLTLLPLGSLLVLGAVFIADTASTSGAPETALALQSLGMITFMIALTSTVAVSIHARGLIKLVVILESLVSLLFFTFGIAAFVKAETLKKQLTDNWTSIRRVLPPTFSGKYDQEQFADFVETNLQAAGFVSLCMGVLLLSQVWAGIKLRKAIKDANNEEEENFGRGGANIASQAFGAKPRDAGRRCCDAQRWWKRNWTRGTKRSRLLVGCCCTCLCLVFLLIVGVATMALYFSSSCSALSEFSKTLEYNSGAVPFTAIAMNNYTRGANEATIDASASALYFTFERSALQASYSATNMSSAVFHPVDKTLTLTATPKEATEYLGLDVSCQQSTMTAHLPPKTAAGQGDSYAVSASADGLTLDFQAKEMVGNEASLGDNAPRFKFIKFTSEHGGNTLDGVKIGAMGAEMKSDSGELFITGVDAQCNPQFVGDVSGGLRFSTELGGIVVQESTIKDCDLVASGEAALIRVDRVTSSTTLGVGALIDISSENGLIEIKDTTADELSLRGNEGSVRLERVTVHDTLKASSVGGSVVATDVTMGLRGSIQIETSSGGIQLKLLKFAGLISLHTSGTITVVDHTASHYQDYSFQRADKMSAVTANVNCASQGNCPYLGEIVVTSSVGDIELTVAAWDQVS